MKNKFLVSLIASLFCLNFLLIPTIQSYEDLLRADGDLLIAEIIGDLHCEAQYPCECSVMTNLYSPGPEVGPSYYENVNLTFGHCGMSIDREFFQKCMREGSYVSGVVSSDFSGDNLIDVYWNNPVYINTKLPEYELIYENKSYYYKSLPENSAHRVAVYNELGLGNDQFETDLGEYHILIYDNDYTNLDIPVIVEIEHHGQRYIKEFEKPKSSSNTEEVSFEDISIKLKLAYNSATFGNIREWNLTYFYAYLPDYFPSEPTPAKPTTPKPTTPSPTTPRPTTPSPTTPPPTKPPTTTPIPTTTPPPDGLTPEKMRALAERYAPTLYFYSGNLGEEIFFLIEAQYFVDISDTNKKNYELLLHPQSDPNDKTGMDNALQWQKEYESTNYKKNPVYVHVAPDTYKGKEYLVIQYWFCYLFNFGAGYHEGEWEMIEVILEYDDSIIRQNRFPDPYVVAYSYHIRGEAHKWSDEIVQKVNEHHPIVYVGYGTHASHFDQSISFPDIRNDRIWIPYEKLKLELLDDQEWLNFDGRWGRHDSPIGESPKGPKFQGDKWDQPVKWAETLKGGVEFGLGSPAHLLITNSKGQKIGYVEEEFVNEISGAYPLITEEHEFYQLPHDKYSVEINAFEEGEIDFDIRINDNGKVTYISYENKLVTSKTKAYAEVDPSKEEYEIKVDRNGDGKIDETIKPDNIIKYNGETKTPIPTTPPSPDNKILFFGIIIAIIIALVVLVFCRGRSQPPPERPPRELPRRPIVRRIPERETGRGTRIAKKPRKETPRRERIEAVPQENPILEVHKAKKEDAGKNIVRIDKKMREKLRVKKGDYVYVIGKNKVKSRVETAYKNDTGKNIVRIDKKLREKIGVNFKDKVKIEKVEEDEE